mmetsp:Transcript_15588/g.37145  ORF Transcript_15588/g.37145 Transcript_15588/m.37145 type:complete len:243 (+) Transcript_15588:1425-2153(+)
MSSWRRACCLPSARGSHSVTGPGTPWGRGQNFTSSHTRSRKRRAYSSCCLSLTSSTCSSSPSTPSGAPVLFRLFSSPDRPLNSNPTTSSSCNRPRLRFRSETTHKRQPRLKTESSLFTDSTQFLRSFCLWRRFGHPPMVRHCVLGSHASGCTWCSLCAEQAHSQLTRVVARARRAGPHPLATKTAPSARPARTLAPVLVRVQRALPTNFRQRAMLLRAVQHARQDTSRSRERQNAPTVGLQG